MAKTIKNLRPISFFVILSTLLVLLVSLNKGLKDGLWILTALFLAFFCILIINNKYTDKLAVRIILFIAYIRYVVLPFAYYFINTGYYSGKGRALMWFIAPVVFYNVKVITIMAIEMTTIFLTIMLLAPHIYNYEGDGKKEIQTRPLGISTSVVAILGIILIIIDPGLSGILNRLTGSIQTLGTLWDIIYGMAELVWAIGLLNIIKSCAFLKYEKFRLAISLIVWLVFCLGKAIGEEGSISRWGFLISFLIGYFILKDLYSRYKGELRAFLIIMGILGVSILTMQKFEYLQSEGIQQAVFRTFNYKSLNAYFAGPTNMAYTIRTKDDFGKFISFRTLVNDIFGNMPIVNHITSDTDKTFYYFNRIIYGSWHSSDQICPFTGQAYLYMSYFGVVIMNIALITTAMFFENKANQAVYITWRYVYYYLMIIMSMGSIINISIIFQYVWITILPVAVLFLFDIGIKEIKVKTKIKR